MLNVIFYKLTFAVNSDYSFHEPDTKCRDFIEPEKNAYEITLF